MYDLLAYLDQAEAVTISAIDYFPADGHPMPAQWTDQLGNLVGANHTLLKLAIKEAREAYEALTGDRIERRAA
jgi:hypothetical protein